ncbi:hypothetical protein [Thermococcus pacificus]|uniref:hypothetical protein n=1 Tax=Thermococcus pacificus TaxID=71998 RepID=UPI003002FC3A
MSAPPGRSTSASSRGSRRWGREGRRGEDNSAVQHQEGTIEWYYDGLKIEVYRRSEEEKLAMAMEELEERERALEGRIKELEELALRPRGASKGLLEKLEELKQEHTSLKLRAEG